MSHLLCPISRQPVQFCESAACLFFFLFFYCLFFIFIFSFGWEGVACIQKRAIWGVGTVCLCMNAFESNLFKKKGFSERTSLQKMTNGVNQSSD